MLRGLIFLVGIFVPSLVAWILTDLMLTYWRWKWSAFIARLLLLAPIALCLAWWYGYWTGPWLDETGPKENVREWYASVFLGWHGIIDMVLTLFAAFLGPRARNAEST